MQTTAIIIVNNLPFSFDKGVFDQLATIGGADEVRYLRFDERTVSVLCAYENQSGALFAFADDEVLPLLSAALSKEFENFVQCDDKGAGVFSKDGFDLLLGPIEETRRLSLFANVFLPRLKRRGLIEKKIVLRGVGCDTARFKRCVSNLRAIGGENLRCTYSERFDDVRMEIFYGDDTPKVLLDEATRIFAETFSEELYAMDDTPIEKRLCELLKVRGKKISVAESFTGGGVGRRIVSVSGASEVYFEGLNTYNGEAKIKRLNVSPYTLNTLGAVSDQTAYEMCAGLLSSGDCGAAIATTGIAGPNSDESGLPAGLCFLAAGADGKIYIARHVFSGGREAVTEKAINHALFWAYKHLK